MVLKIMEFAATRKDDSYSIFRAILYEMAMNGHGIIDKEVLREKLPEYIHKFKQAGIDGGLFKSIYTTKSYGVYQSDELSNARFAANTFGIGSFGNFNMKDIIFFNEKDKYVHECLDSPKKLKQVQAFGKAFSNFISNQKSDPEIILPEQAID